MAGAYVLGVDPGLSRIGLAISDEEWLWAFPLETVKNEGEQKVLIRIAQLISTHQVGRIVVGFPLRLDGKEGPEARRARRFRNCLAEASALPVELWDERLTTVAAERCMRDSGVNSKKQRARVDQAAASILLQSYLDAKRSHESPKLQA
ncbi:MAG: Holliday junction resolvase RuvX [Myxococcota bacterium]